MASSSAADPLVHVAFNSKGTHFVAATSTGIRVFSCSPLKHMFSKNGFDSPDGGFGSPGEVVSADMALSGPVVAVVFRESGVADSSGGGGHKIRYWSELYCQMMPNMSPSCRGAVRAVRHVGNHVLVAGEDRVTLHETSRHAVRRTGEFDTGPNPLGVCALAQAGGGRAFVLACPRPARGEVQVRHGGRGRRVVDVDAHSSSLACVALSRDGRLLATASSKGTVLRVFGTTDGKKLQEFRRGKDRADIHCMAFSPDSMWLAVSSDKATVHVFKINVDLASLAPEDDDGLQATSPAQSAAPSDNKSSYISYLTGLVPGIPGYLKPSKAECSLAKFHLRQGVKYYVAFSHEPYTVLIVGMDGSFYRCQFNPVKAGEMKQLEYRDFMSIK